MDSWWNVIVSAQAVDIWTNEHSKWKGASHSFSPYNLSKHAGRSSDKCRPTQHAARAYISAFVGQANFELTRERHDSSPIPFYMLPHIGGSSTLRGFALDRFYGRNLALLSLEYRYRIHPFVQVIPFFDEGQIFDRTEICRG